MTSEEHDLKGEELLNRLLSKTGDSGTTANDLLNECFRGYPLANLRRLLTSGESDIVKTGAWIVSELGAKGQPLLGDIAALFDQTPGTRARFFAIDCVLSCATAADGGVLAAVVRLIDDNDSAIRWKVIQFLIRVSTEQLLAVSAWMKEANESEHATGIEHLIASGVSKTEKTIELLESDLPTMRRFALAAAVRVAVDDDRALRAASDSTDEEIRSIAIEEKERANREKARRGRS